MGDNATEPPGRRSRRRTNRRNEGRGSHSARHFESHLTTHESNSQTLRGDAPVFRPLEPVVERHVPFQPPRRRHSKSRAPDIIGRIHEDISNGVYECPICTNDVLRKSRIWSCRTCFTVFHLSCVKKWAENQGSTHVHGEDREGRSWRCPGCNLPKDTMPAQYKCWCEKECDPSSSRMPGLHPHSCGQTCGRARTAKKCPHPCELQCHAGPCPPCDRMGPDKVCFCGRHSKLKKCIETNYDTGWSCLQPCNTLQKSCGEHKCSKPCHAGPCGECEVPVQSTCYCGQVTKEIACSERIKKQQTAGSFQCDNVCSRPYSCGIHSCNSPCHPHPADQTECPHSPKLIRTCPCGKTPLDDQVRRSCIDAIPHCDKICSKELPCKHRCKRKCHSEACPPCMEHVLIPCRCGRIETSTVCHQGSEELPLCARVCRAALNCNRHECGEHCCTGERQALERTATAKRKKKTARSDDPGVIEAEHICTRTCGRPLKCSNHACPELCHRGACRTCREAVFEDLSCNCGRTVIQAPVPCGTKPPPCRYDCERTKSCGHPQTPHPCHQDDESCPRCPFLIEKECACKRTKVKSVPCYVGDARCGEICGKMLACGSHYCRLSCHPPGRCEDSDRKCLQVCGREKPSCSHPCQQTCHPATCPESKPCPSKVLATCSCQHTKQTLPCLAASGSPGNASKVLQCTDDCKEVARKYQLADALGIDISTHQSANVPYSSETLAYYSRNSTWAAIQEKAFREFASDPSQKRLRFTPMSDAKKRAFVHLLAEDYGLDAESMDPVPHRHVAVFKTPRFQSAPAKTLKQCVTMREYSAKQEREEALLAYKEKEDLKRFNALVLLHPKFGLTTEDLESQCGPLLSSSRGLEWDIEFTQGINDEVVIKPHTSIPGTSITDANLEALLKTVKGELVGIVSRNHLASSVVLARVDADMKIQRQEGEGKRSGVWSTVVTKGNLKVKEQPSWRTGHNSFTVLGSRANSSPVINRDEIGQ